MEKTVDHVRLVKRAQLGDKESLDRLTEVAEERLRVDVFRLVLQEELAGEIVQESLFEMLRVLKDLKDADRFWPWLYKIALNKVRLHYRAEQRRRAVTASAATEKGAQEGSEAVMAGAISEELKDIVIGAMRRLKPRYRAVLTMRCYREMEYWQIAESMGCSEFAAKMLFYRAKKSLRKQLARFGFGKGMLLAALVLFGKLTARSEAAHLTVSAAAMKVGAAAGAAGFATSTSGIVSLATAAVLAVGAAAVTSGPGDVSAAPGAISSAQIAEQMGGLREGVEESWSYYPQGASGPVMTRLLRWDSAEGQSYCQWLQNGQATYYYDKREDTVHIRNSRMWRENLAVWRLPTDPPELSEFLSRVEGRIDETQYIRGDGAGLLVIARRNEADNYSRVTRQFNILDEQYFLYDWPARAKRVDSRDAMHKRGWAYFVISGRIGEKEVSGVGRIPFVDSAAGRFGPWVKMEIGAVKVGDNGVEARVYDGERLAASYVGGSFFAGLGRPWMGLHTVDTVRRDAALGQVWFETSLKDGEGKAEVALSAGRTKATYTIDIDKDVIERIGFLTEDGREGELRFSYVEEISPASEEFVRPSWGSSGRAQRRGPGMLWIVNLVNGKW
jgi:RNA polymerase sigma factor (sigma-70 family)